jgi:hypothetical protein
LTKKNSAVAFAAIEKAVQKYTIPYLKDKWGCFNQTEPFEFNDCTYHVPWNNESLLAHWTRPPDAVQSEKIDFLLSESYMLPEDT